MERGILYALLSTLFAGATAVIAKQGLHGISAEIGLAIRTCFVLLFVLAIASLAIPQESKATVTSSHLFWLGVSGAMTAASWFFYFKAIKISDVSTVAVIDKGSFIVAIVLAWIFLGEQPSPRTIAGALLIIAGLLVVAKNS